jgi:hypothetical protein
MEPGIMTEKRLLYGIYPVSMKDGSKKTELVKDNQEKARSHYARYYQVPLNQVIGYDYCRIRPIGMI